MAAKSQCPRRWHCLSGLSPLPLPRLRTVPREAPIPSWNSVLLAARPGDLGSIAAHFLCGQSTVAPTGSHPQTHWAPPSAEGHGSQSPLATCPQEGEVLGGLPAAARIAVTQTGHVFTQDRLPGSRGPHPASGEASGHRLLGTPPKHTSLPAGAPAPQRDTLESSDFQIRDLECSLWTDKQRGGVEGGLGGHSPGVGSNLLPSSFHSCSLSCKRGNCSGPAVRAGGVVAPTCTQAPSGDPWRAGEGAGPEAAAHRGTTTWRPRQSLGGDGPPDSGRRPERPTPKPAGSTGAAATPDPPELNHPRGRSAPGAAPGLTVFRRGPEAWPPRTPEATRPQERVHVQGRLVEAPLPPPRPSASPGAGSKAAVCGPR